MLHKFRVPVLAAAIVAAACLSSSVRAQTSAPTHLQFAYVKLMAADEAADMKLATPGMAELSYVEMNGRHLPYTAPPGYRIGITSICISSKMNDRSSYLAVMGVYSHADRVPCTVFPTPLWLTPGGILNGTLINNSGTQQWMIGIIQAVLEPIQ